jgi:hypothetical protein
MGDRRDQSDRIVVKTRERGADVALQCRRDLWVPRLGDDVGGLRRNLLVMRVLTGRARKQLLSEFCRLAQPDDLQQFEM